MIIMRQITIRKTLFVVSLISAVLLCHLHIFRSSYMDKDGHVNHLPTESPRSNELWDPLSGTVEKSHRNNQNVMSFWWDQVYYAVLESVHQQIAPTGPSGANKRHNRRAFRDVDQANSVYNMERRSAPRNVDDTDGKIIHFQPSHEGPGFHRLRNRPGPMMMEIPFVQLLSMKCPLLAPFISSLFFFIPPQIFMIAHFFSSTSFFSVESLKNNTIFYLISLLVSTIVGCSLRKLSLFNFIVRKVVERQINKIIDQKFNLLQQNEDFTSNSRDVRHPESRHLPEHRRLIVKISGSFGITIYNDLQVGLYCQGKRLASAKIKSANIGIIAKYIKIILKLYVKYLLSKIIALDHYFFNIFHILAHALVLLYQVIFKGLSYLPIVTALMMGTGPGMGSPGSRGQHSMGAPRRQRRGFGRKGDITASTYELSEDLNEIVFNDLTIAFGHELASFLSSYHYHSPPKVHSLSGESIKSGFSLFLFDNFADFDAILETIFNTKISVKKIQVAIPTTYRAFSLKPILNESPHSADPNALEVELSEMVESVCSNKNEFFKKFDNLYEQETAGKCSKPTKEKLKSIKELEDLLKNFDPNNDIGKLVDYFRNWSFLNQMSGTEQHEVPNNSKMKFTETKTLDRERPRIVLPLTQKEDKASTSQRVAVRNTFELINFSAAFCPSLSAVDTRTKNCKVVLNNASLTSKLSVTHESTKTGSLGTPGRNLLSREGLVFQKRGLALIKSFLRALRAAKSLFVSKVKQKVSTNDNELVVKEQLFDDSNFDFCFRTDVVFANELPGNRFSPNKNKSVHSFAAGTLTLTVPISKNYLLNIGDVKAHIRVGHISLPTHLLIGAFPFKSLKNRKPANSSGCATIEDTRDLMMSALENLLKIFSLIDLKLINLKIYHKFFYADHTLKEAFSDHPYNARTDTMSSDFNCDVKNNSIQIIASNVLTTFRKITDFEYGIYFEIRDIPIECTDFSTEEPDTKADKVKRKYDLEKHASRSLTHEILISISGLKVKLFNDTVFHLPLSSNSIHTNVYNIISLIITLQSMARLQDLSPQLRQRFDRIKEDGYRFLMEMTVSNPCFAFYPRHVYPLMSLVGSYMKKLKQNNKPETHTVNYQDPGIKSLILQNLELITLLLPTVDMRILLSEIFLKVSDLRYALNDNVTDTITIVAEIQKIFYEIQSKRPSSINGNSQNIYGSDNNDIVLCSDELENALDDASYVNRNYFFNDRDHQFKAFETSLVLDVFVIKSYHGQNNLMSKSSSDKSLSSFHITPLTVDIAYSFPMFHFRHYKSESSFNFNFLKTSSAGATSFEDCVKRHFNITCSNSAQCSNIVLNLTKKTVIFALCQLAQTLQKIGDNSENIAGTEGDQSDAKSTGGLIVTLLAKSCSKLTLEGVIISLASRDILPRVRADLNDKKQLRSTVRNNADLSKGLRGVQLCLQKIEIEVCETNPGSFEETTSCSTGERTLGKIMLDMSAGHFKFLTILETSLESLEKKPMAFKFLDVPGLAVKLSDGNASIKAPTIQLNFDISTIWMAFVLQYTAEVLRNRVRSASVSTLHVADDIKAQSYQNSGSIIDLKVDYIACEIMLPQDLYLLLAVDKMSCSFDTQSLTAKTSSKSLDLYAPRYPEEHGDDSLFCLLNILSFRNEFTYDPTKEICDQRIPIVLQVFRFCLPFNYTFYKISDSIVTMVKCFKQIKFNFSNLKNRKELVPRFFYAEKPKILPEITISTAKLNLEIKDDPFESELALIYKAGLVEQKERYEKLLLFEEKSKELLENYHSEYQMRDSMDGSIRESFDGGIFGSIDSVLEKCDFELAQCRPTASNPTRPPRRFASTDSFINELIQKKLTLFENFSKSWIRRFLKVKQAKYDSIRMKNEVIGIDENVKDQTSKRFNIHNIALSPSLLSLFSRGFCLRVKKFDYNSNLQDFLYDVGKGMPKDTEYTLLIPFYLHIDCDVLTILLRDYYLPILHFPTNYADDTTRALTISGNVVLAEQLNLKPISKRTVYVPFVPCARNVDVANPFYGAHIWRSLDPVKFYTDLSIVSHSPYSTVLSWGKSLQPSISTVMLCLDSVSKPPIDMSPKIGWWDKFRLIIHGRFHFKWTSRVNLFIKGSLDPYKLTDDGAGFVFSWSEGAELKINPDDDPARFMVTASKQFTFAVPQFSTNITHYWKHAKNDNDINCSATYLEGNNFQKVVANLKGDVHWHAGLLLEKEIGESSSHFLNPGEAPRTFMLKPHYLVERANPYYLSDPTSHDSYDGFRSHYIHLSLGFSNTNTDPSCSLKDTYNAFHITPYVVAFFQKWWGLFNNSLGLPLRHGPMFASEHQDLRPNKKLGASLYTFKYQIQLTPLFLSHFFRHSNMETRNEIQFTGLKMKANQFQLDLHQRKQKIHYTNENLKISKEVWHMKFNKGKIDCDFCDTRLVNTTFNETSIEDLLVKSLGIENEASSSISSAESASGNILFPDLDKTDILRNDNQGLLAWVDINDYVELDAQKPSSLQPRVEILPLFMTPRFTYLRQDDKNTVLQYFPFGEEPSHHCFYEDIKPQEETLLSIVQKRSNEIEQKILVLKEKLKFLGNDKGSKKKREKVNFQLSALKHNLRAIKNVISGLKEFLTYASVEEPHKNNTGNMLHKTNSENTNLSPNLSRTRSDVSSHVSFSEFRNTTFSEAHSKFNNRFIINNLLLKWNNRLRNYCIKYLNEISDLKSLRYFMGRKIVKYLEDFSRENETDNGFLHTNDTNSSSQLEQFLNFCSQDYLSNFDNELCKVDQTSAEPEFSYLFKLICPQVQFQSEEKKSSVGLVLTQDIELKVLHINAKYLENVSDDDRIARLMETRFGLYLKEMQTFVISLDDVFEDGGVKFHSKSFGSDDIAECWPPWINFEGFYESSLLLRLRVSERTSASARLDKVNNLFFSNNKSFADGKSLFSNAKNKNILRVDAPKFVVTCDSTQFDVIYTIVTNLVVFSDFKNTKKSQKLRELVLASDLENLERIDKYVEGIQRQIRALKETKHLLQMGSEGVHSTEAKSNLDLVNMWVSKHSLRLLYSVRAIQGSASPKQSESSSLLTELLWRINSDQIIWHLLDNDRKPLIDLALAKSCFLRTNHADGSSTNTIAISIMQGFNLHEGSVYPELLKPFTPKGSKIPSEHNLSHERMAHIEWKDLQPIGGIPVMEYLKASFQPLAVQIDSESAKQIFEFVFPASSNKEKGFGNSHAFESREISLSSLLDDMGAKQAAMMNDRSRASTSSSSSVTSEQSVYKNQKKAIFPASFIRNRQSSLSSLSSLSNTEISDKSRRKQDLNTGKLDYFAEMAIRSSKFVTFTRAEINNVIICLSYKGKGRTSIADVDELIVKVPNLTYVNYICSFKDLALDMKKDIIKVLVNHTGKIIGNKFKRHSHHNTNKQLFKSGEQKKKEGTELLPLQSYGNYTSIQDLYNDTVTEANTAKNYGVPPVVVEDNSIPEKEKESMSAKENGSVSEFSGTDAVEAETDSREALVEKSTLNG